MHAYAVIAMWQADPNIDGEEEAAVAQLFKCCGIDRAMSRLSGSHSRQQNDWNEALSRISAHLGCNLRTEPRYVSVGVAAACCQGARHDPSPTLWFH
jgi:hypothetical protein